MKIIDCHAHAFPDDLAPRAMARLTAETPSLPPQHDGTLAGLLGAMDRAGVHAAVIANIATKPTQQRPILDWSKQIASDRVIPFISLHPAGDNHDALLDEAVAADIRGVKFHCLYQGFVVDEPAAIAMYERIAERGLVVLFHAGRDPYWMNSDDAAPSRLLRIRRSVPGLKMIAAHTGGWRMWDDVANLLAGEDIVIETSFIDELDDATWDRLWTRHPHDHFVFGSDSPWTDQAATLAALRHRAGDDFEQVASANAIRLLGLAG